MIEEGLIEKDALVDVHQKQVSKNFNRKAAVAAYDLIMKMDDDEARMFATMVVTDVLHKTMDDNHRTLQRHINDLADARVKFMKRAIAKAYQEQGPTEDLMAAATALEEIEKAWGSEEISEHPRGVGGRFVVNNRKDLNIGQASYDLMSALGANHDTANAGANALHHGGNNLGQFSTQWTSTQDRHNSNAQLYNRVKSGSTFLGQVVPGSPKVQVAAKFGEFVGEHGPNAEKVFGPPTRKSMYRFRGTERKPDEALINLAAAKTARSVRTGSMTEQDTLQFNRIANREAIKLMKIRVEEENKGRPYNRKITSEGTSPSRQERAAGKKKAEEHFAKQRQTVLTTARENTQQVAISYLGNRLPQGQLTDLQLKSGHTPPSEGVIISPTGEIVSQAVGYGDDHYLPFTMATMNQLKGGEYVRTRAQGGPTSEDIYAGLMSGARRLTVVSRSGVFTMEFEDDFRGGRRYNQKAGRMADRYEKLLDAVRSGKVSRKSMDRGQELAIRQEVRERWAPLNASEEIVNAAADKAVQEAKDETKLSPKEVEAGMEKWKDQLKDYPEMEPTSPTALKMQSDIMGQMLDEKALNHRLNGYGYASAMDALHEQFPYYLKKPEYSPRRGYEPGEDRGYVNPRHNRPVNARAGYFDASIDGGTKFSAQFADHQNKHTGEDVERSRTELATDGPRTNGATAAGQTKVLTPQQFALQQGETEQRKQFAEYVAGMRKQINDRIGLDQYSTDSKYDFLFPNKMSDEALKAFAPKPENRDNITTVMSALISREAPLADLRGKPLIDLQASSGAMGRIPFDPEEHITTAGARPFTFTGDEFLPGQSPVSYEENLKEYNNIPALTATVLGELSDDGAYKAEATQAIDYVRRVKDALEYPQGSPEREAALSGGEMGEPSLDLHPVVKLSLETNSVAPLEDYIIQVQKARAIKAASATAVDSQTEAAVDRIGIGTAAPETTKTHEDMVKASAELRDFGYALNRASISSGMDITHKREAQIGAQQLSDRIRSAAERGLSPEEIAGLESEYDAFKSKHRDLFNKVNEQ